MADLHGSVVLTIERYGHGIRVAKATVAVPGRIRAGERVVRLTLVVPEAMFKPTPIPEVEIRLDELLAAAPLPLVEQMPAGRPLTDEEAGRLARQCPDCPHMFGLHDEGGVCRVTDCPCVLPETIRAAERLGRTLR